MNETETKKQKELSEGFARVQARVEGGMSAVQACKLEKYNYSTYTRRKAREAAATIIVHRPQPAAPGAPLAAPRGPKGSKTMIMIVPTNEAAALLRGLL